VPRCILKNGIVLRIFVKYVSLLVLGVLMLAWVVLRTVNEERTERVRDFAVDTKGARAV
jgi:hypothetical protein